MQTEPPPAVTDSPATRTPFHRHLQRTPSRRISTSTRHRTASTTAAAATPAAVPVRTVSLVPSLRSACPRRSLRWHHSPATVLRQRLLRRRLRLLLLPPRPASHRFPMRHWATTPTLAIGEQQAIVPSPRRTASAHRAASVMALMALTALTRQVSAAEAEAEA